MNWNFLHDPSVVEPVQSIFFNANLNKKYNFENKVNFLALLKVYQYLFFFQFE